MRMFLAALAALPLLACSNPAPSGPAQAAARPASCDDPAAVVTLSTTRNQPEWLLFARQSGGGDIQFNQHSIRRCGNNEAEITVRVRYAEPQLYTTEEGNYQTTIRYHVEHVRYRYQCDAGTFSVAERRIIDDQDRVVATIPGHPELFRPMPEHGTAALIQRTACLGR